MFINDAHIFGLSELHQLRGRVGRYKHRAYCYLILPRDKTINEVAMKRLAAIENFSMLGAGFKIALRDLEIRGAGNLLGAEQSGHIATVGYEMYCQLLEEAVNDLKSNKPVRTLETTIDIGIKGAIPKGYVPSDTRRMDAYRRISRANDHATLDRIEADLISAYGDPPRSTRLLLHLADLQVSAATLGIASIARHEEDVIFRTTQPREMETKMRGAKGTLRVVGQLSEDGLTEVYYRPPPGYFKGDNLLTVLRQRLRPDGRPDHKTEHDAQGDAGSSHRDRKHLQPAWHSDIDADDLE
jgi:transcription-repair coupling factor (superfamily II helicase)